MGPREPRRLIVNADDFGRSPAINAAIVQAHTHGILTSASLMVNEPAAADAVALARQHPRLGVGLHLVLACGTAALTPDQAPELVRPQGHFDPSPVRAGLRYFFLTHLRSLLRREIEAQFQRFADTDLPLDHLNGHLNIHLHPTVLRLILDPPADPRLRGLRLTRDPLPLNLRLAGGRWAYRLGHALVFALLAAAARSRLRQAGLRTTQRVFGLLQNGRVDEAFLLRLLDRLPAGDSELYSHPSLTEFRHELDALVSRPVRQAVDRAGIQLIRYQDL
ncbi:MAG TPA: hopanoid biosynthesis-associated protein HpnK [Verrucomicrobiota bacterium]|nr:hopanoid biosynthesis-associated protein HpnK [Verrucomicrobiota bacterium]HNU50768.1 hopanoid biosynthesis-associated protein HpnK [Verrucomicrobiota bacterium]